MPKHTILAAMSVGSLIACGVDSGESDVRIEYMPRHCVATASSDEATCFEEFTDAIAFATDGRILDAPADSQQAMFDETFKHRLDIPTDAVRVTASYVVAINFQNGNYGGTSLTFTSNGPCTDTSGDYRYPVFPSDWNDKISSFYTTTGSGCGETLYEHANYQGRSFTAATAPSLPSYMNDAASTAIVFHVGVIQQ